MISEKPYYISGESLAYVPKKPQKHWTGFDNIGFTLTAGGLIVLQGKSGSGKSQLLKILAGEMLASSGTLSHGAHAVKEDEDNRCKVLFINETDSVKLSLKVRKQLRCYAKRCGNLATVDAAIKYFNLEPVLDIQCSQISEGYRRRLLLTQLLFSSAKLWLLDDPFKGLDEEGVGLVQALIQARIERDGCVIMSAQNTISNPNIAILNMNDYQVAVNTRH